MRRWEYRVITFGSAPGGFFFRLLQRTGDVPNPVEMQLNALGREGWELVSIEQAPTSTQLFGTFKRALPDEAASASAPHDA